MPDYLLRSAALFSAIFPVVWLGLLLVYASRRRMMAEAANVAFIAGFLSALTVLISFLTASSVAEGNVIGLKGVVAISFLRAALPEEAAKLAVLLTIVYRHEDIQSRLDYILAAGWVSLGFACLENIFYVFGELNGKDSRWLSIAFARAVTAVPSHTITGVLMGCLLARSVDEKAHKIWWIVGAFFAPFLLHGLYDVCVLPLRKEFAGFLTLIDRWYFAFGLGAVMTLEAWLTAFLIRQGQVRWRKAAPLPSSGSRWIEHSFTVFVVLTVLLSLGLVVFGIFATWKGNFGSGLAGAGIAWLGIVYVTWLLRGPVKVGLSDLTPSPQVPISKDLTSG
ncbi:PrsW family intramembrane metalloprotease [Microvirga sp. VF16]|uniref:PrsW family intramembrane metalloprotease n=1 Tax=Microvirga sp. VF16 TaxID=2807101 RepID=UPI00193EB9CB|nr:PrsW family glutamic-type intramembrane protease [Microvirga sp. VF16]QRM28402.1 PrsW family intramembrane metalloprotease [Microvirga sp. VF16]